MKVALTEGGGETFFKPKFLTAFSKKLQEIFGGGGIKLLTIDEVHYTKNLPFSANVEADPFYVVALLQH